MKLELETKKTFYICAMYMFEQNSFVSIKKSLIFKFLVHTFRYHIWTWMWILIVDKTIKYCISYGKMIIKTYFIFYQCRVWRLLSNAANVRAATDDTNDPALFFWVVGWCGASDVVLCVDGSLVSLFFGIVKSKFFGLVDDMVGESDDPFCRLGLVSLLPSVWRFWVPELPLLVGSWPANW